jgi:hypothetical protein
MKRPPRFSGREGRDGRALGSGERATSDRELYAWLAELRQRHARGEPLTARELMCLQMVDNGYGCAACARAAAVVTPTSG